MVQNNQNSHKKDCLFCQIVQGKSPSYRIYETKQILAFLDIYPQAKGHTLIVPKTHSVNLLDTKDDLVCAAMSVAKKLAKEYRQILQAEGFIVTIHNGEIANQIIPHFHIHLIPVYENRSKDKAAASTQKKDLQAIAETITSQLDLD
jgi:histidine triad (HIT) family protein